MWACGRGSVFGLLGPNGAGKSTLLNVLTGEARATAGAALLCGIDAARAAPGTQLSLGLCPQSDAGHALLTPDETLRIYAAIKGVPGHSVDAAVAHLVKAVGIEEHAHKVGRKLSGGTRRKLSAAMALLGAPRTLLLDEPSTGLDPVARRRMWAALAAATGGGRSAVLTTHLMEECEALCPRLGILVNGRLACLGTPQQLKSRHGGSLMLEVQVQGSSQSAEVAAVEAFVRELCPSAVMLEWHGSHRRWQLQQAEVGIASVFRAMEANKQRLRVESYAVSQTTLEQVFLQKAKEQVEDEEERPGGARRW